MDLKERPTGDFVRHPWEVSRSRFYAGLVKRFVAPSGVRGVLDVGGGDGWFSQQLLADALQGARIVCWDSGYGEDVLPGLEDAAPGGIEFTAARPSERFSLILLLDVLEHVEDDGEFLGSLVRDNLVDGGHVLLSVPAWPWLYTQHDRNLGHYRRYTPRAIRRRIREAGLSIVRSGQLFHGLLTVRLLQKLLERARGAQPNDGVQALEWRHGPRSARFVQGVLGAENLVSYNMSRVHLELPGLSWWAVCRKPR